MTLTPPDFITFDTAARQLIERAARSGVALRVIGGLAIWQRLTGEARQSYEQLRGMPRDIDL